MQTVENPSELPERFYEALEIVHQPITTYKGFLFLIWMFKHPYIPFILTYYPSRPDAGQEFNVIALAELCGAGLATVAATGDGFTLTAQGRLWVAHELKRKAQKHYSHDEWDDEYSDEEYIATIERPNNRAREIYSRLSDTY